MTVRGSLALGFRKVNRTKRMIAFAWIVNVLLTLVVAAPMLAMLDASIAPTVMEERLLDRIDLNWLQTFRADHPDDPIVRMLGLSIFGAAPFYDHLDNLINGRAVTTIGRFLGSLVFEFRVNTHELDVALILLVLYVLLWTYLSGGFVGVYAREQRSSFNEFLQFGARNFGRFFRLAIIQLLMYFLIFAVVNWLSGSIRTWTSNEPSEMTAFTYFMMRNVAVLLIVGLVTLVFDYAKIRMVVDGRVSALGAFGGGVRFVVGHPARTSAVAVVLAALGGACAGLFVLLEAQIPQSSFWPIVLVFVLQQIYVWCRQWIRAGYYATQTALYQTWAKQVKADEPGPAVAFESKS
jgi:hypothetical protein